MTKADDETQDRYGRNSFGWSLLMAFRLVEAGRQPGPGQPRQQRDLGHPRRHLPPDEGQAPPADRPRLVRAARRPASPRGLLDSTLIVMGSEFGRTPKLSTLTASFPAAGRDHWGAVQSVFFAGRRHPRRHGRRLVRQDRRLPRRPPADAREHGGHDLPRPRHPRDRRLARRARPPAPDLSWFTDSRIDLRGRTDERPGSWSRGPAFLAP